MPFHHGLQLILHGLQQTRKKTSKRFQETLILWLLRACSWKSYTMAPGSTGSWILVVSLHSLPQKLTINHLSPVLRDPFELQVDLIDVLHGAIDLHEDGGFHLSFAVGWETSQLKISIILQRAICSYKNSRLSRLVSHSIQVASSGIPTPELLVLALETEPLETELAERAAEPAMEGLCCGEVRSSKSELGTEPLRQFSCWKVMDASIC